MRLMMMKTRTSNVFYTARLQVYAIRYGDIVRNELPEFKVSAATPIEALAQITKVIQLCSEDPDRTSQWDGHMADDRGAMWSIDCLGNCFSAVLPNTKIAGAKS